MPPPRFHQLPGVHNDETHDCPRYVSTADYETELGNMADAALAKGATPIKMAELIASELRKNAGPLAAYLLAVQN